MPPRPVGWRQTYLLMAAVLAAALGILAFALRDAPAETAAVTAPPSRDPAGARSMDRRAALATPAFWALTVGLMGCGFTDFLMTTHLAPYATDLGMTPAVAANAVSLWAAANVAGILAAGTVAARIGTRAALVLTYGLRAAALFYLPLVREPWQLYLFAGLFGATFFTTAPLSSTMVGQLFGPAHHGAIFGAAQLFHHSAGALGSYAGGLVFDLTGSYRPIFLLAALVVVGSAVVTSLARRPAATSGDPGLQRPRADPETALRRPDADVPKETGDAMRPAWPRGTGPRDWRTLGGAVDRAARGDAREVGQVHRLDPVAAGMQGARIEAESRDDRRVAVVPGVRVPDQRLEEHGMRLLDAPEHALAVVGAQRGEARGAGGSRRLLDSLQPREQEPLDVGR